MEIYEELEFLRDRVRAMRRAQTDYFVLRSRRRAPKPPSAMEYADALRHSIALEKEVDLLCCPVDVSLPDNVQMMGQQTIYFGDS
jgi:hypothetical protein